MRVRDGNNLTDFWRLGTYWEMSGANFPQEKRRGKSSLGFGRSLTSFGPVRPRGFELREERRGSGHGGGNGRDHLRQINLLTRETGNAVPGRRQRTLVFGHFLTIWGKASFNPSGMLPDRPI
jgi:hypothetical protein